MESSTRQAAARTGHLRSDDLWALIKDLPEAAIIADATGQVLAANRCAADMFGYDLEADAPRHLSDVMQIYELRQLDGDLLTIDEWPLARALRGEQFSDMPVEVRRLDRGTSVVCSFSGSCSRDENGAVRLGIITAREITQITQANQELQSTAAFYRRLQDSIPHLLFTMDNGRQLRYVNARWREYVSMDAAQVNAVGFESLIHPDDRAAGRSAMTQAFMANQNVDVELRLRGASGQHRWFLLHLSPIDAPRGYTAQWIGIATDIHDLKMAEERIRRNEQRLRLLTTVSTDGIWEWDVVNDRVYMSDRLFQLLGETPPRQPMTQQWMVDRVHPEDLPVRQQKMRDHLERNLPYTMELRIRRGDGTYGHFITHGIAERDASGRPIRVVGTIDDITDRRRYEQALREARDAAEAANRAKDHFLAILSHELRTPLTPVLLFSSSLERNPNLPEDIRGDLALIRQQIQLEARLIDDLLDLTRIQRGKMLLSTETIHLHDVLRRVAGLSTPDALANEIQLVLDLGAKEDLVDGDPARLQQLFANIVNNAIKFTTSGGTIEIRSFNENEQIVIEVRDTGIGIAAEMIGRIFNAFEQADQTITRRFGGLGLGLTIGKAIVEMHNGRISARSPGTGHGATLRVELPLLKGASPARPEPPEVHGGSRQRVLLVEDHEPTRQIVERLLERIGFDVISAGGVATALHAASRHHFDILLSDIGLGDGSGTDLLKQLQPGRTFRAIALSGYGTDDDIKRSLDAGFEAHLVKPVDMDKLEAVLRQVST